MGCPEHSIRTQEKKKSQKVEQSVENATVKYHLSDQQRSTTAKLTALYEH